MNARNKIKAKVPAGLLKPIQKLYYKFSCPQNLEQRKSYGKLNADKTIYIIRPTANSVEGLLSLMQNVVRHLYYAEKKGYIPVVDFENYITQYSARGGYTKHNVWNDYFTQPSSVSLEEAYKSKNVILSGIFFGTDEERGEAIKETGSYEKALLMKTHNLLFSKIHFSDAVDKAVAEEMKRMDVKSMLGLYVRGTDYTKLKPSGHPIQPTIEQIANEVERYRRYGFKGIFLVTEDGDQYKKVVDLYGNEICTVSFDRFITSYDSEDYICNTSALNELGDTPYERGLNYLVKIILLSKCGWFIGGKTKGSWGACMFNAGKYQDMTVFDLGTY